MQNTRIAVARECARGLLATCLVGAFAPTVTQAQTPPDPAIELRRQQERAQAQQQQIQGQRRDVTLDAPEPLRQVLPRRGRFFSVSKVPVWIPALAWGSL